MNVVIKETGEIKKLVMLHRSEGNEAEVYLIDSHNGFKDNPLPDTGDWIITQAEYDLWQELFTAQDEQDTLMDKIDEDFGEGKALIYLLTRMLEDESSDGLVEAVKQQTERLRLFYGAIALKDGTSIELVEDYQYDDLMYLKTACGDFAITYGNGAKQADFKLGLSAYYNCEIQEGVQDDFDNDFLDMDRPIPDVHINKAKEILRDFLIQSFKKDGFKINPIHLKGE